MFYYYPLEACQLSNERKGVDPDGRKSEEELVGIEGQETVIRIFFFSIKGKNSLRKSQIYKTGVNSTPFWYLLDWRIGKYETGPFQSDIWLIPSLLFVFPELGLSKFQGLFWDSFHWTNRKCLLLVFYGYLIHKTVLFLVMTPIILWWHILAVVITLIS